jgi:hypothetical protein
MYEVQIDFGSGYVDYTAYLVGQYPIKRTRQIHNGLKPVIGTCQFALRNNVSLVNQFLAASTDPAAIITHDGAAYFAGTIRKTVKVEVGQLRIEVLECECVDPFYRLEGKKIRTSIVWSDYKVSDPTNKAASILHQLFYLAGFQDSELNLAAIDTTVTKYTVDGTDKAASIRSKIEVILRDTVYTLRPTRAGVIELYDLAPESYSPTATIKTGSGGNIAEGYSAKRDEYKEEAVDVTYWSLKTLVGKTVFEDTTGATASLPCSIPVLAGAYYPNGAEAGESVRGAYKIENEELICVEGAMLEWAHTGDVTLEDSTEDGLGMLLRFHSSTGGVITKLRIVGNATIKDQKNKVSDEIIANSDEREEIESKIINTKTPAERLAKGRAAWHKYSTYQYTFKKITIQEKSELIPGEIVLLKDAELLGALQILRVVKVVDGSDPKSFSIDCEGVGLYVSTPIFNPAILTSPQKAITLDIAAAQAAAAQAAAEQYADLKSRTFFDQPIGPYKRGDLWIAEGILYQATADRELDEFYLGDWVWCIRANMTAVVESTNGDKFRPGQSVTTTLIGRAFRNGVEITNDLPDSAFKWTRKSFFPTSEDAVWNINHQTGYRTVEVTTDSIYARATYSLEISE